MALTIIQKPEYKLIPASAPIYYTVSDTTAVATKFKVKYVADIHVLGSSSNAISSNNLINTVKVSPNANGVGIMDLKSILSSQVDTMRLGSGTTFKGLSNSHAIHLIDDVSDDDTGMNWYVVNFKVEYSDTAAGVVSDSGQSVSDDPRLIYNGYLFNNDVISQNGLDYGYNLDAYNMILNDNESKFLSDMPTQLYARTDDFGTIGLFDNLSTANESFNIGTSGATVDTVTAIKISFKGDNFSISDSFITLNASNSNNRNEKRKYVGVYPANLINSLGALPSGTTNYNIVALDDTAAEISKTYNIRLIDTDCKGYEGIRLAWINKYGVFDYYTFNKKSTRTINSKRQNYTQHSGTWNSTSYFMNGSLGGQRSFNVSSKESITINTDYITEEEGIYLEQLVMSPEVYLINQNDSNDATGLVNKYVEPVLLTSDSITRKTKANDKLITHTFTIEKSKNTNTQRI